MFARSGRLFVLSLALLVVSGCVVYTPAPAHSPAPPPMAPPPPPRPHSPAVEVGYFHDALDPWGDWVWLSPHGWVWAPAAVDPFWRPYTVGRWVWSDYGWMWVSDEDWGWATYHYGRWARVPRHGWVWVPGTVWGPSWVAWRNGPGVIGWAPLPPEVGYRAGVGLDLGHVDLDIVIRPDWWCFVDEVRLLEPRVMRHAWPVGRNVTVIRRTTRVVHIEEREGRVYHRGLDRDLIERVVRRPVPRYRVLDQDDDRGGGHGRRAEVRQNEVRVWRPDVREPREDRPPRRAFGNPQDRPAPGQARQPDRETPPRERAEREPAPLPPVAPPVEKRIERSWEKDWRRLQENRRRDQQRRPPDAAPAAPKGPPAAGAPPAQRTPPAHAAPPAHEQAGLENQEAAENAYQEQQAQRARVQREAEKPRPKPAKPIARVRGHKDKNKSKDQDQKEKD
jgi:hypothetical protein